MLESCWCLSICRYRDEAGSLQTFDNTLRNKLTYNFDKSMVIQFVSFPCSPWTMIISHLLQWQIEYKDCCNPLSTTYATAISCVEIGSESLKSSSIYFCLFSLILHTDSTIFKSIIRSSSLPGMRLVAHRRSAHNGRAQRHRDWDNASLHTRS